MFLQGKEVLISPAGCLLKVEARGGPTAKYIYNSLAHAGKLISNLYTLCLLAKEAVPRRHARMMLSRSK